MKRFFAAGAAILAICGSIAASAPAFARQLQPFAIVNNSGYTITHVFVRLDGMSWSRNWLRYTIRPNQDRDFSFTGGKSCTGKIWLRTQQRAEFNLSVDFCYGMTFVLTNDGLDVEY
ncbi:hypothetical protein sos41_22760 [Alphaproteobacteria bacterium SO-S41]|nr:hypothetical protein sos41_22760 [Alphaproteobacteria bacterium SO-S41]